jgi:hypothetical protein
MHKLKYTYSQIEHSATKLTDQVQDNKLIDGAHGHKLIDRGQLPLLLKAHY